MNSKGFTLPTAASVKPASIATSASPASVNMAMTDSMVTGTTGGADRVVRARETPSPVAKETKTADAFSKTTESLASVMRSQIQKSAAAPSGQTRFAIIWSVILWQRVFFWSWLARIDWDAKVYLNVKVCKVHVGFDPSLTLTLASGVSEGHLTGSLLDFADDLMTTYDFILQGITGSQPINRWIFSHFAACSGRAEMLEVLEGAWE